MILSVTSTIKSGQDETGPIVGFRYKHEHSSIEPSLVGTLTRDTDLAHTTKSSSCPVDEKTQYRCSICVGSSGLQNNGQSSEGEQGPDRTLLPIVSPT